MTNFLVILVGLGGGYLLRKTGKVPASAPTAINAWILNIAMPAVIFQVVPGLKWSPDALAPLVGPVVVLAGAWVFQTVAARLGRWNAQERTALFLTSGLANTSFVGFPLILAYYGAQDLPPAVLADQMSFLLLATVGLGSAALAGSPGAGGGQGLGLLVLRRVLSFPPLLAFPLALLWPADWGREALGPLFQALAATLAPLALFSVGVQLSFTQARAGGRPLVLALVYKLLLAPVLVLAVVALAGWHGPAARIAVFEAAMAPMITTAVVAAEFGVAPRLATAVVGMGIPVSLVTTALWWWVLGLLGW